MAARANRCSLCGRAEHLNDTQREKLITAAEVMPDHQLIQIVEAFICMSVRSTAEAVIERVAEEVKKLSDRVAEL